MSSSSSFSPPREVSGANTSPSNGCCEWSAEENKLFENSLATYAENMPDLWQKISEEVIPGKTPEQIKKHYDSLVEDLRFIDTGRMPIPQYANEEEDSQGEFSGFRGSKKSKNVTREQERRKGIPWTEDEHRLFLMGLNTYGKGDWRSISRNFVISRTPTQVASHAQKYFNRLNSSRTKERRRPSIHDIRSVRSSDVVATSMNTLTHSSPITNVASSYNNIAPSQPHYSSVLHSAMTGTRFDGMGTYSVNDPMGASGPGYFPPATYGGGFGAFGSDAGMATSGYGSFAHNPTTGMQ